MSRIPQPLVLATKVALECLPMTQKWRSVQPFNVWENPGWMVHQQDDLGHLWIFVPVKNCERSPCNHFMTHFVENTWKLATILFQAHDLWNLGLDKLLHPTKTTYRPCDDAQKAPKHQRHWPLQTKKPTCTSQKVTAGFPEKMMWDFCQVRLVHPQKFQGKVQLQPFPHFQVNEPFVFGGGSGALSFEKIGCVWSFEETFPIHNHHLLVLGNILKVVFQSRNSSCF